MVKRLLSAAAVLALLANPIAIWAQAGACMQLCLASCNKQMMAAHHQATAVAAAPETHHSHCDGMHQSAPITTNKTASAAPANSAPAQIRQAGKICHTSMNEAANQSAHNQKPVAPCCQSTHNTHVMDAGVSPALLIGLLPENFALAQLHAVRQRVALDPPTQPHFVSSPPFEPPRS